ncbi:MAG TPA: DNA translocase FtsK [Bacteroidales bacterium]|nr:DNA translocase FtsK [Bacteroidales bacterium]
MAKEKDKKPKEDTKEDKKGIFTDIRFKAIAGILLILFSVYLTVAFVSFLFTWKYDASFTWQNVFSGSEIEVANWAGKTGARIANWLMSEWMGYAAFGIPIIMFVGGTRMLGFKRFKFRKTALVVLFGMIISSLLFGYFSSIIESFSNGTKIFGSGPGGAHGYFVSHWLNALLGKVGTGFMLLLIAFTYTALIFKPFAQWFVQTVLDMFTHKPKEVPAEAEGTAMTDGIAENMDIPAPPVIENPTEDITKQLNNDELEVIFQKPGDEDVLSTPEPEDFDLEDEDDTELELVEGAEEETTDAASLLQELGPYDPTLDLSNYKYPTIELLEDHKSNNPEVTQDELISNKNKIVETLKNYKIEISHIKATIGPTVTLYEIIPAPGVRISKIKSLENDIALSLAALGIRIIAPIPGRGTIGIEVPNRNPETVSMRSVVSNKKFQESNADLAIVLGKTISNDTYVVDLAKMPHLLVAGATGQGKSVGLNAILTSLLYKKHPSELKLVLIDPKKVELTLYSKLEKHFLAKLPDTEEAIITDTQKVINTLNSLTIEMEDRYSLLKKAHVRTIKEYNTKFKERRLNPEHGHRFLPYIVLIIDEFADLIMTAGREIETPIARLAQLARAIGIHLIIATQRPTTNIITGMIKANFPARIAFRVISMIDSRTILDSPGANQLIGRGDMLVSTGSDLIRVQCAFVDTPEIEKIVDFIGNQPGYSSAFLLPEVKAEGEDGSISSEDLSSRDSLFDEAARLIVMHQQGSTSLIQRKFSIGYNRAGRIMDQLEVAGIVGPSEGSKARQVLVVDEMSLEHILKRIDGRNN